MGVFGIIGGMVLERVLAGIVDVIAEGIKALGEAAGFSSLKILFFGANFDMKYPAPFTEATWTQMDKMYNYIAAIALAFMLISVFTTSIKYMGSSINTKKKSEAQEDLWRWLGALVMIASIPVLARLLFLINNFIVSALAGMIPTDILNLGAADFVIDAGSPLMTALCDLLYAWQWFKINLIFLVRDWTIYLMYVFGPIAIFLWTINKNVTAFPVFFGELLSNAFLQSAYALVGAAVFSFLPAADEKSVKVALFKLLGIYMIVPLANVIRNGLQGLWTRWAGLDEERVAGGFASGLFTTIGADSLGRLAGTIRRPPNLPSSPPGSPDVSSTRPEASSSGSPAPSGRQGGIVAESAGSYQSSAGAHQPSIEDDYTPENTAVFGGFTGSNSLRSDSLMARFGGPNSDPRDNSLVKAINRGRLAYTGASTVVRQTMALGMGQIPGGKMVANLIGYGTGKVAQVAVTTGSFAYDAAKQGISSAKQALREHPVSTNDKAGRIGAKAGYAFTGFSQGVSQFMRNTTGNEGKKAHVGAALTMASEFINSNWTPTVIGKTTRISNVDNSYKRLPMHLH